MYAPNDTIENYYRSFSTHIKLTDIIEYKKGKPTAHAYATMFYMSLIGDNNFKKYNVLTYMQSRPKLFYDCKIFKNTVSSARLIIDPLRIVGYEFLRRKYKWKRWVFMHWVDSWCKKQVVGSDVYIFNNAYTPKLKFYLLTNGYEEVEENYFKKVDSPPKASYRYL